MIRAHGIEEIKKIRIFRGSFKEVESITCSIKQA
jgi:hypothetical protein